MVEGNSKARIKIKLRDEMIPWGEPCLGERERDYLLKALDSTWISGGEFIDRFESDFARLIGTKYAVTTSSTAYALHLALLAWDSGHEPSLQCTQIATAVSRIAQPNLFLH